MKNIPDNFRLIYSQEQIEAAVARLGSEITTWATEVWEDSHTDILTIPILRGGIFFFADLVREIGTSVEIEAARSWAYEAGVNAVQRKEVKLNLDTVPAKGRAILLVDDICDSGNTLAALTKAFNDAGAREVRSAVLIQRKLADAAAEPTWAGFIYEGSEWFVGYGMEDRDRWRNLPSIHIIQQHD